MNKLDRIRRPRVHLTYDVEIGPSALASVAALNNLQAPEYIGDPMTQETTGRLVVEKPARKAKQ